MSLYYSTQLALALTTQQVSSNFGFNPDTYYIDILNDIYNLFPVNTVPTPVLDDRFYSGYVGVYTANGDGNTYDQSFTLTERPLAETQATISTDLKSAAEADAIVALGDESATLFTSQSYLTVANRLEPYKSIGTSINAIATALDAQVTAVNAATTVKEVGVVGTTLTGALFTGRGSGLGPDDLNLSYYVTFNHSTLDQSETELFVPSTSTVIPYTDIVNNNFDSAGNCFNGVDYEIQIRETSSSTVLAEFVVPLNASGETVTF